MPTGTSKDYKLSEEEWKQVEYLKSNITRTGYRTILTHNNSSFRVAWREKRRAMYSSSFHTIAEAVWWLHTYRGHLYAVEKYPEYYWPTPAHVDLAAIEYLKSSTTKSGYVHVSKTKGTFYHRYRSSRPFIFTMGFATPQEAAWDYHCKWPATAKKLIVVPEKLPPIDYAAIAALKCELRISGYRHVKHLKGRDKYCGNYYKDGVRCRTPQVDTPEEAAWMFLLETKDMRIDDNPGTSLGEKRKDRLVDKYLTERKQILSLFR